MPDEMSYADSSDESLLEEIARAEGDRDLFPYDVIQLFESGKARKARRLLLKQVRTEPNLERRQKQLAASKDLRIWIEAIKSPPSMSTINGIGTMLYGEYQRDAGTYIATLWFTFVFVPLWPLAAFLVQPAHGDGWQFLARTPFPPVARWARKIAASAIALIVAGVAFNSFWADSHLDLFVVNGFDQTLTVRVAGEVREVRPHSHAFLNDLPLANTTVSAAWTETGDELESMNVDFGGHGGEIAVYNVADRAVIVLDHILYGDGDPSPDEILQRGPVVFVDEKVDYRFVPAPDSLRVSENGSVEKSILVALDEGGEPLNAFMALLSRDRAEQALTMARSELSANPDNATLAYFVSSTILSDDFGGQVELYRSCMERAPNSVDLHRGYQELWVKDARGPLRQEYADLLRANPDSPMYHYLLGRIEEIGSPKALSLYRSALDIDPEYAPVYRALGYEAVMHGDWLDALEAYDRFASLGGNEALEVLESRIRIRRLIGRSAVEIDRVLLQTRDLVPDGPGFSMLTAHLKLERDPGLLSTVAELAVAEAAASLGVEIASSVTQNWRADLAVTAGDLAKASQELSLIADPEERNSWIALRVALSSGANQQEEDLLLEIPEWFVNLDQTRRILALELLEPAERWQVISAMQDSSIVSIARALEDPAELVQTRRFAEIVDSQLLEFRAAAYFAAARRLENVSIAGAARARQHYQEQARVLGLPGELPGF